MLQELEKRRVNTARVVLFVGMKELLGLSITEYLVAGSIYNFSRKGPNSSLFLAKDKLATLVGLKEAQLYVKLRSLQDKGLIVKIEGRIGLATRYRTTKKFNDFYEPLFNDFKVKEEKSWIMDNRKESMLSRNDGLDTKGIGLESIDGFSGNQIKKINQTEIKLNSKENETFTVAKRNRDTISFFENNSVDVSEVLIKIFNTLNDDEMNFGTDGFIELQSQLIKFTSSVSASKRIQCLNRWFEDYLDGVEDCWETLPEEVKEKISYNECVSRLDEDDIMKYVAVVHDAFKYGSDYKELTKSSISV